MLSLSYLPFTVSIYTVGHLLVILKVQLYKNSKGVSKNWKQRREPENTPITKPKPPFGSTQSDIENSHIESVS